MIRGSQKTHYSIILLSRSMATTVDKTPQENRKFTAKTLLYYISLLNSITATSPSPLFLYSADLRSAYCQETVREPENNIEQGEGGLNMVAACLAVKAFRRVTL